MEYPVFVSFRCPVALDREVRIAAAKEDMNRSEFILSALKEKLERARAERERNGQEHEK